MNDERDKAVRKLLDMKKAWEVELNHLLDHMGFPCLTEDDICEMTKQGGDLEGYEIGKNLSVCVDESGRVLYIQPYIPLMLTPTIPKPKEKTNETEKPAQTEVEALKPQNGG